MRYNYGSECKKFDAKWDRLNREYAAAGMSEAAIGDMRDFDWEELKSERVFRIHNQSLECFFPDSDAMEDNSPLFNRQLERLSVSQPEICTWDRLGWIDDLDTAELAKEIKSLSYVDQELLSYLVVDGMTRAEISRALGVSRAAITQKLNRIKGCLEKVCYQY